MGSHSGTIPLELQFHAIDGTVCLVAKENICQFPTSGGVECCFNFSPSHVEKLLFLMYRLK